MPRVTVILSTYNWSSVLPYSIGSVLRQTYGDWELLVVGDCCTDDSETVVKRMSAEHEPGRVRWINLPTNTGNQYGPNNEGLRQARGEFIAYLGHDDLWLPHHLSVLVAAMDRGADLAHAVVRWVEPSSQAAIPFHPAHCVVPASVMHRRSLTEALGGWRDFREIATTPDQDLWLRARDGRFRFAFVPRLTLIKFSAATRRDVYKTRPCHEQAAWSQRIADEPDLEAVELANLFCATYTALVPPGRRFHTHLASVLWQGITSGLRRRLRKARKGEQVRAWRTFKGLESEP